MFAGDRLFRDAACGRQQCWAAARPAFDQMTLGQWSAVIGVNLTDQFLCTGKAAGEFKRCGVVCRGRKGRYLK